MVGEYSSTTMVPNYILAGGQVVSSRDSVSRDPLSAQVGDRRAAAIACSSLCCNLYGSPLQLTRAYLGETSIAQRRPKMGSWWVVKVGVCQMNLLLKFGFPVTQIRPCHL